MFGSWNKKWQQRGERGYTQGGRYAHDDYDPYGSCCSALVLVAHVFDRIRLGSELCMVVHIGNIDTSLDDCIGTGRCCRGQWNVQPRRVYVLYIHKGLDY